MKAKLVILLLLPLWTMAQTEVEIQKDSLPALVKEQFSKKYNDYSISKAIKAIDKGGIATYKLEAQKVKSPNETTIYNLVYDVQGKLLSKKKDKEIFYTDPPPKKESAPHKKGDGHNH